MHNQKVDNRQEYDDYLDLKDFIVSEVKSIKRGKVLDEKIKSELVKALLEKIQSTENYQQFNEYRNINREQKRDKKYQKHILDRKSGISGLFF